MTPSPWLDGADPDLVSDNGVASCLDARTGAITWRRRIGSSFSASPVLADGRLHFQDADCRTVVLRPGRGESLAVNALDGATLASLAVAPTSLFVGTVTHRYRRAQL